MASGTRAPSTIVTVNLTGQTEFNIPFEYLARKYVIVTLLGVDRKVLTLNTDYRFVGKTIISLANPTPAGYTQLELRRVTGVERLVDFYDGSILRATDLNLSQIQSVHIAEEARNAVFSDGLGIADDGNLDARGRRIKNVARAIEPMDAVPLGQVTEWDTSAYNSAERAEDALRRVIELESSRRTILSYGASVTSSDNSFALTAMASDVGYIRVPNGVFNIGTITLDYPLHFEAGASLAVNQGSTLTLSNTINSPRQTIFKGSGSVKFLNDADSGEDAYMVHVSWFGVYPVNDLAVDCGPALRRLMDGLNNTREAVVEFDNGRYPVYSAVSVPRAVHIKGAGSRRTIIEVGSDGYDVFTTLSNGCRFTGIQFELKDNYPTGHRLSGWYIKSTHQLTDLDDVWVSHGKTNILLAGGKATASRIRGTFNGSVGADSALLHVEASDVSVTDVMSVCDEGGPESVVSVGGQALNNISGVTVSGVRSNSKSIPVKIVAKSKSITGVNADRITYRGLAGQDTDSLVLIETSGTGVVEGVTLDGFTANDSCKSVLTINQQSTGRVSGVSLSTVSSSGSGAAIKLTRGSGSLSDITIDQSVNVKKHSSVLSRSGTMSRVSVHPSVYPDRSVPAVVDGNIQPNSVLTIETPPQSFTGMVTVTFGTAEYVMVIARTESTARITKMLGSANVNVTTGPLTGTTGAADKLTVSADVGKIHIENRMANAQRVSVSMNYGVY